MPVRFHRRISPYSSNDASLIAQFKQIEETATWFGQQCMAIRKAKEHCESFHACLEVTHPMLMPLVSAQRLQELAVAWVQWSIPFDNTASILKFSLDQLRNSINNAHETIQLSPSLISDWTGMCCRILTKLNSLEVGTQQVFQEHVRRMMRIRPHTNHLIRSRDADDESNDSQSEVE